MISTSAQPAHVTQIEDKYEKLQSGYEKALSLLDQVTEELKRSRQQNTRLHGLFEDWKGKYAAMKAQVEYVNAEWFVMPNSPSKDKEKVLTLSTNLAVIEDTSKNLFAKLKAKIHNPKLDKDIITCLSAGIDSKSEPHSVNPSVIIDNLVNLSSSLKSILCVIKEKNERSLNDILETIDDSGLDGFDSLEDSMAVSTNGGNILHLEDFIKKLIHICIDLDKNLRSAVAKASREAEQREFSIKEQYERYSLDMMYYRNCFNFQAWLFGQFISVKLPNSDLLKLELQSILPKKHSLREESKQDTSGVSLFEVDREIKNDRDSYCVSYTPPSNATHLLDEFSLLLMITDKDNSDEQSKMLFMGFQFKICIDHHYYTCNLSNRENASQFSLEKNVNFYRSHFFEIRKFNRDREVSFKDVISKVNADLDNRTPADCHESRAYLPQLLLNFSVFANGTIRAIKNKNTTPEKDRFMLDNRLRH